MAANTGRTSLQVGQSSLIKQTRDRRVLGKLRSMPEESSSVNGVITDTGYSSLGILKQVCITRPRYSIRQASGAPLRSLSPSCSIMTFAACPNCWDHHLAAYCAFHRIQKFLRLLCIACPASFVSTKPYGHCCGRCYGPRCHSIEISRWAFSRPNAVPITQGHLECTRQVTTRRALVSLRRPPSLD